MTTWICVLCEGALDEDAIHLTVTDNFLEEATSPEDVTAVVCETCHTFLAEAH